MMQLEHVQGEGEKQPLGINLNLTPQEELTETQILFDVGEGAFRLNGAIEPEQFTLGRGDLFMECLNCGMKYYANGSDIWQRKCPSCQGVAVDGAVLDRLVAAYDLLCGLLICFY